MPNQNPANGHSLVLTEPQPLTKPRRQKKNGEPSAKDLRRWALWRKGSTVDELAARDCVSPEIIHASINQVQIFQHLSSHEVVDMSVNSVVLNVLKGIGDGPVEQILRNLMNAKRVLVGYGPNGEDPILEPDHDTQIKVIDGLVKLIDKVRPKGAGLALNLNQTNNTLNQINGNVGKSFEQRLRDIREKNGLRNDQTIVDAEVVDTDEEEDDDDADDDVDDVDDAGDDDETADVAIPTESIKDKP